MTNPLMFGNPEYRPELTTMVPTSIKGVSLEVFPAFRHSHSPEETARMLADKVDKRPIKRFYPHDERIVEHVEAVK